MYLGIYVEFLLDLYCPIELSSVCMNDILSFEGITIGRA
jgi:hypothetical protein